MDPRESSGLRLGKPAIGGLVSKPAIHDVDDEPVGMSDRSDVGGIATSVGKALAVLDAFRGEGAMLGVSQIAERAKLPKSTTHRLLTLLVDQGYVERTEGRYRLGRVLFELGSMVPECRPRSLRAIAMPFMTELYEATHATVHLAVLDGDDVLYIEKIYGHRSIELPSRVGGRVPALCTALGKAIVAFSPPGTIELMLSRRIPRLTTRTVINPAVMLSMLNQTRLSGIAEDAEGSRLGARCFAAPIPSRLGAVLGALSVSFALGERIHPAVPSQLKRAASLIGASFIGASFIGAS